MDSMKPAERPNATVRPSGETAGAGAGIDFVGGDVKLRVSPVSVDISVRPRVTIHLPSGNQEKKARAQKSGKVTSATTRSGPPMAGITMKVARSFDTRTNPIERPSGEKAGQISSAGSVVNRCGSGEPISLT